jgi:DNA-binding transcriptional ArsR family regulator
MQQIGYDILAYMAEHPDAQDTAEGIIEWWLAGRAVKPSIAHVEEALAELTALGLVIARRSGNARALYKVNPRKLKEISSLLRMRGGPEAPED